MDKLPLLDSAVFDYIAESTAHDPAAVWGIENVLLLLLNEVGFALKQGESADNTAGLLAAGRVNRKIRSAAPTRGVKRWLINQEGMLVRIAESLAIHSTSGKFSPILQSPFWGEAHHRRLSGPVGPNEISEWTYELVPQPLPSWYVGRMLCPPSRMALVVDRVAHQILTRNYN